MPKVSRNLTHRKNIRKKFGFLRFLVIVLSFISLISRVIYCTFATWLTITTFDCIPCANSTPTNASSDLFIAHHSSAIFKTVRALNVESGVRSRPKRSSDPNNSHKFMHNYSQFFANEDNDEHNQTFSQPSQSLDIEWSEWADQQMPNNSVSEKSEKSVEDFIPKSDGFNEFLEDYSQNQSDTISSFFEEQTDPLVVPILTSNADKSSNEKAFDKFTYIPTEDLLTIDRNSTNRQTDDTNFDTTNTSDFDFNDWDNNTIIVTLDESQSNRSNIESKRQQKSLLDSQEVNDTFPVSEVKKTQMNVCSEDCAQFLNIELSDPDVRKWATIIITGVLYLYAFVMLCIFMSSCLALVDLLVVSTFIEGAKLFAGFILIIIDSFNGKELHLNLIDIKFNVNSGGNGWTADFSYSEYLLDIIIFFLSAYLSIRVFKCFERRPKMVSSVEELADTRGTYRPNPSRNSLDPIYEQN